MHIALDIDGTITEAPAFFALLTRIAADARITILSFRNDEVAARRLLEDLGIRFDALVLVNDAAHGIGDAESWEAWKAGVVAKLGVDVFFEDMPEVIQLVQPPTKVFMVCDPAMREWLSLCVDRV
jgi:hypothetical protein